MQPAKQFLTNHLRAIVITTTAIAIAAAGITLAVSAGGGSSPAIAAPTTTTPTTAATTAPTGKGQHQPPPRARGTITTMTPTQWTITNAKGQTLTVAIGPATKYGTTKAPTTVTAFSTGQTVVVTGNQHGTTIQATRIAAPAPTKTPGATPTTTTPTA